MSTVDPAAGPALEGRVAWSVPLPEQPDGELVVAPDGRVLISTRGFLAMAQPTGEPGWLAPTEAGLRCGPVPLDGELIARAENDLLITRHIGTGAVAGSSSLPGVTALAPAPEGEIYRASWTPRHGLTLSRSTVDGAVRWSQPLAPDAAAGLASVAGEVVAASGALLQSFDPAGTPRWRAGRHGFASATGAATGADDRARVRGGPEPVPGGRVLVEFAEPDGYGLYLADPRAGTVRRLNPPLGVHPPVAVLPGPGGLVAVTGPAEELDPDQYRWMVLVVDATNRIHWSHRLPAPPVALLAGAGRVVLVAGPAPRRERGRAGSGECLVRCLDEAGQVCWTWRPPVPLTYRPALGPDGTVYVAAPGRLWALR